MKIVNLSEHNSVINKFLAEIRDVDYQKNRLIFRNNLSRIGELMAYEISKTLYYKSTEIQTPLGFAKVNQPDEDIVLATILRAGLPFHQGFLNIFDKAAAAYVSASRKFTNNNKTEIIVDVKYLVSPDLTNKTLIIADPMLATGESMELGYGAFITNGKPSNLHIACIIATPDGLDYLSKIFSDKNITIWCATIDKGLNEHKYILPGLGDAGDLCFGDKL